jgi:hypothetical protein
MRIIALPSASRDAAQVPTPERFSVGTRKDTYRSVRGARRTGPGSMGILARCTNLLSERHPSAPRRPWPPAGPESMKGLDLEVWSGGPI